MKSAKSYILTIAVLGTFGYCAPIICQESPVSSPASSITSVDEYYDKVFNDAIDFVDQMDHANNDEDKKLFFTEAMIRFNEIVNTQDPIKQDFLYSVMAIFADMLFKESLENPDSQHIAQAREMINTIIEHEPDQIDPDTWAKAYIILARMDAEGMGLQDKDPAAALQDLRKFFEQRRLLSNIALVEASLLGAKLIYQNPEISSTPDQDLIWLYTLLMDIFHTLLPWEQDSYKEQLKEFYYNLLNYAQSIIQQEDGQKTLHILTAMHELIKQQPKLRVVKFKYNLILYKIFERNPPQSPDLALFNQYTLLVTAYEHLKEEEKNAHPQDIKDFNDARLHYAQRLYDGFILPEHQRNFPETAKIYSEIIDAGPEQTNPTTINKARVNLASMYLRGEGLPENKPNKQVAKELLKTVESQYKENLENVLLEDRKRTEVGLGLLQTPEERQAAKKRKLEEEAEIAKKKI